MRGLIRTGGWVMLMTAPLFVGCASFFRQPENVEATREDVADMHRKQTEMMALLLELRNQVNGQSESMASLRADTNLALRELTEKLEALMAQTQEQSSRSERRQPPAEPVSAGAETSGTGAVNVQASFDAAKRDFSRGNYTIAIAGFDEVLALDARGALADDSQYWKGEAYYSLGQVDTAIQELLRVRDVYPESNLVCAATYKVGLAFLRKKDEATAKRYFETVVRECPNSAEASGAKDKLKGLE